MKQKLIGLFLLLATIFLVACSEETGKEKTGSLKKVQLYLDWTPNTNHSGIYVAKEKGYFEEHGLDVEIMLPGEVRTEQIVATNKAPFGISFQPHVTQARAENLPVVSIAAIIQHHTGGYGMPADKQIKSPKDFEGRTYGAYGSSLERALLQVLMEKEGGNADLVDFYQLGNSDVFAATQKDIDFVGMFYAWTGIEALVRGIDFDFIRTIDYAPELDTYSPLIITNEKTIEQDEEMVQAFVHAVKKGYDFAINQPEEAAAILIQAVPDLNPELVKRSQEWLSPHYKEGATNWGTQELERWQTYADFMYDNQIIDQEIDAAQAFDARFIEEASKK